jgi:hypothetical protein
MPQSEEESAPLSDPTKTLVRGSDGNYYVICKNAITATLTPAQKDHVENTTLYNAQKDLTDYLNTFNNPSLASGVRIRIAELF